MTNQLNPFQPAIDALEKDLTEIERKGNALLATINVLREKAGLPPRPGGGLFVGDTGGDAPKHSGGAPQIKHDTFFGKKMGTAARLYLEMRFETNGGTNPAKPREIFDALKEGGFVFETKDDGVAIISLRNMLRKSSQIFQKLPNGTYGLCAWYPNAKKPKAAVATGDQAEDAESEIDADTETETGTAPKAATGS